MNTLCEVTSHTTKRSHTRIIRLLFVFCSIHEDHMMAAFSNRGENIVNTNNGQLLPNTVHSVEQPQQRNAQLIPGQLQDAGLPQAAGNIVNANNGQLEPNTMHSVEQPQQRNAQLMPYQIEDSGLSHAAENIASSNNEQMLPDTVRSVELPHQPVAQLMQVVSTKKAKKLPKPIPKKANLKSKKDIAVRIWPKGTFKGKQMRK